MINLKSKTEIQQFIKELSAQPHFKKRLWNSGILSLVVVTLSLWAYGKFHVSTDDAYVNADVVQIAPLVSGRITNLYVANNQTVNKGQVLFEIDPLPYLIAVDRAKAQLALARQGVAEKSAAVTAAQAQVAVRAAEWHVAQSTSERTMKLVQRHVLSQQTGDDTTATYQKASAALDAAKASLSEAQITLGKTNDDNEQVLLAKANLRDAELNLSYTRVVAPSDGVIANMTLRTGSIVTNHQLLFALISTANYWVDTNLKETDLKGIRAGQAADVEVDMYPGHVFKGIVESISGGSGTAFSLLPPQNATGNWVKVTQRVPVRVRIIQQDTHYPLRIGTSATVKIRTPLVS